MATLMFLQIQNPAVGNNLPPKNFNALGLALVGLGVNPFDGLASEKKH